MVFPIFTQFVQAHLELSIATQQAIRELKKPSNTLPFRRFEPLRFSIHKKPQKSNLIYSFPFSEQLIDLRKNKFQPISVLSGILNFMEDSMSYHTVH
jgi:hypothetical protein